jgi:hypothetical protein
VPLQLLGIAMTVKRLSPPVPQSNYNNMPCLYSFSTFSYRLNARLHARPEAQHWVVTWKEMSGSIY